MHATSLAAALDRIGQVQARLPGPAAAVIALAAIGAAVLPDIWLLTRHVTVMAHEGGHATMGSAMGRRITAIRLTPKGEGVTETSAGGMASSVVIGLSGYLGPSVFGIGAAELISIGHIVAVLWAGLVALVLLMVPLRRSFGVVTVIAVFILLVMMARYGTLGAQVMTAYGLTWFMLVSGVRGAAEHGTQAGDAHILYGLTRIPRGFWSVIWLAGTLLALAYGAKLLL
jgi:hypothetical protein